MRKATRLLQPSRQVLLSHPVSRANCTAPIAFLPVRRSAIFCLKATEYGLGHEGMTRLREEIDVRSPEATTTLIQGPGT
jgi:hypothetical protein